MKKKKNEVVINNKELEPTVLATLKPKKTSLIGLILLFIVFIGVVIFLPDISKFVEDYKNKDIPINAPIKPSDKLDDKDDLPEEVKKYKYVSDLVITKENFNVSNILLNNSNLSFTITNTSKGNLLLSKYNYFLEVYDATDTLISRIKLSEDTINLNDKKEYSYGILKNSIEYFTLREIKSEDYPALSLSEDEKGNSVLECTRVSNVIKYNLLKDKLYSIEEVVTVNFSDPEYVNKLTSYSALATTYNTLSGYAASVSKTEESFIFTSSVNLNMANSSSIKEVNYYKKDTSAKIINFEMEARGYSCK
ncbi:MAG: hypothetical protein RSG95_02770 [Bacilli bacterium]